MLRKTIYITLMILISIICITGCTLPFADEQPTGGETDIVDATSIADKDGKIDYKKLFVEYKSATLPLMPTDFDGIFYTMDINGIVKFYRLIDGVLTETEADGVYSVKPRCSGQNIPADVYYINIDGNINGYGLYTAAKGFCSAPEWPEFRRHRSRNRRWLAPKALPYTHPCAARSLP